MISSLRDRNSPWHMGRRIAPVVIAFGIASGTLFRGYDFDLGMAASCMVGAMLLIFVTLLYPPPPHATGTLGIVLALALVAIGWAALATMMTAGRWPDLATPRLLSLFSGLAALMTGALFARASGEKGVTRLLDALLLINALIFMLGLVIRAVGTDGIFDYWNVERLGRFTGTIGNANVTAAIAAAFTVHALWRFIEAISDRSDTRRVIASRRGASAPTRNLLSASVHLLGFAISCGVLITTASRYTNMMTLVAALAVLLWGRPLVRFRRLARGLAALAGLMALIGVILVIFYSDVLSERLAWLDNAWAQRTLLWQHYLDIAAGAPLFGYGLGAFPAVNAHFLSSPRFAEQAWAVNSAHDLPLQLILVAGLPYLLLLMAAAWLVSARVWRTFRGRWTGQRRIVATMAVLVLGSSLVDITLDMPVTVSLFLLLAGLLLGETLDGRETIVARS